jgi:hypothetical protein
LDNHPSARAEDPRGPVIVVGLLASPGAAADLARATAGELPDRLAERLPGAAWAVRVVTDRLVDSPAGLSELVGAARRRMLAEGWSLAVCLTDLPLQTARRPVVAHTSATHGVAVLSMPALGPVAVARRASDAMVRLVASLLGDAEAVDETADRARQGRGRRMVGRRTRELGTRVSSEGPGVGLVAGVIGGNLRLLLGMLRANRPWRLAIRLSRALVAAFATAVVALVTMDIWRLADGLGAVRLALLTVGSVVAVVLTLVLGAGLWERAPARPNAREQVILFNVVTVITVVIGVLALYLALWALSLVGAFALVPPDLLGHELGHPASAADHFALAWLASSLATAGGALGAGLESDEAIREAAYRYQPDQELSGRGV